MKWQMCYPTWSPFLSLTAVTTRDPFPAAMPDHWAQLWDALAKLEAVTHGLPALLRRQAAGQGSRRDPARPGRVRR